MISEPGRHMPCGMTLIEVLVTLSILSIALLSLAGFQSHTYATNALAGQRAEAVNFAHEQIDKFRMNLAGNMQNIATSGQDTLGPPSSGSTVEIVDLTTLFNRSWTILLLNKGRLAQISVLVSWQDNTGDPHEISLDSIISLSSPLESARITS